MDGYFEDSFNRDSDRYLLSLMSPPDGVLARMEEYALSRRFPFIGPLSGNLLAVLARACGARLVFELGSGFGYSALHFARAMGPEGKVICTDSDPEHKTRALQFFEQAGMQDRMEFHVGEAIEILKSFDGPFDIIFLDIDKHGYPAAFRAAWPKLKVGGLLIADNLLWGGRVMADAVDPETRGIVEFTRMIYSTSGAKSSIIPLRDGVSITVKTA